MENDSERKAGFRGRGRLLILGERKHKEFAEAKNRTDMRFFSFARVILIVEYSLTSSQVEDLLRRTVVEANEIQRTRVDDRQRQLMTRSRSLSEVSPFR